MQIRPIRTEEDCRVAKAEIAELSRPELAAQPEIADRLEVLAALVQAYETRQIRLRAPDPIEAIRSRMAQGGLGVKDLVPMIGQLNRVYEVLGRKRPLSLAMIRRLNKGLGIPAEMLIHARNEDAL